MNRARVVLLLLVFDVVACSAGFSLFEGKSLFDGIWWGIVTGFTVGYGDIYPVTIIGRLVAMFYIVTMALLWLVLGAHIVASIIEDKNLFSHEEQERMEAALLKILQAIGIVPQNFTELPSTAWFAQHYGFQPSDRTEAE